MFYAVFTIFSFELLGLKLHDAPKIPMDWRKPNKKITDNPLEGIIHQILTNELAYYNTTIQEPSAAKMETFQH